jgi:16S rRNA (cytidine1402-2'-O)-methyltransferase
VEDAKSARAWLRACGHPKPLRDLAIAELNEHTPAAEVPALLEPTLAGHDLGLLSEAGMPAVADPGAALVALAHARGVRVVPCVGPSSIVLALAASGLEGQRFRFAGYLPAEAGARRAALQEIEQRSAQERETQVFIETPYRNDAMLKEILATCRATTRLAVAAEITAPGESIVMDTVAGWKKRAGEIGKRPAIFLLLA